MFNDTSSIVLSGSKSRAEGEYLDPITHTASLLNDFKDISRKACPDRVNRNDAFELCALATRESASLFVVERVESRPF